MTIFPRQKIIIAAILVIIAIILILLFWPSKQKSVTPTANQTNTLETTNSQPTTEPKPAPTPVTPEEKQKATAQTVAKIFAERFGSYSSESQADNLEDLLPLATTGYTATLQAQIKKLREADPSADYYGVTTRVLSTTLSGEVSDGTATFDVLTQREEATGSVDNLSITYQTLTVSLKLVGEDWLVNGAVWQ